MYALRVRSIVWDRAVLLGLGALGIALALQPELANDAAHAVGAGRGADLLIYVFVLFSLFHICTWGRACGAWSARSPSRCARPRRASLAPAG